MKAQLQSYQADDLERNEMMVTSHKISKSYKTMFGMGLAAFLLALVVFTFAGRNSGSFTELVSTPQTMGEKGMLKRGMVNDPAALSPGLRDQLMGVTTGEHGLEKKGVEVSPVSKPAVPYSSPSFQAPSFSAPSPSFGAAPTFSAPPPPPSFSAPAPLTMPKAPAAPAMAAPVAAAAVHQTSVAPHPDQKVFPATIEEKTAQFGEKALLKRGMVNDPTQLSPGIINQINGGSTGEHGLLKNGELEASQVTPGLAAHLAGVAAGKQDAKIPYPMPGFGYRYP